MTRRQCWEVRFPSGAVERLEPAEPLTPEQERALGSGGAELARLDGRGAPDIVFARLTVYGEQEASSGATTGSTPLRSVLIERSGCSTFRVGERFGTLSAVDVVLEAARQSLAYDVHQSIGLLLMWRDGTATRCNLAIIPDRGEDLAHQVMGACDQVLAERRFAVLHALAASTLERIIAASAAEARGRTHPRPRLEDDPKAEYSESAVRITFRFITQGVLRGRCGHLHKSLKGATRCLMKDELWCQEQGADGHSDRRIFVVGGGTRRELSASELATVDALRPAIAKELAEPQSSE